MKTSDALLGIGAGCVIGLMSWFLTIPMGEAAYEMFLGRKPPPGSWRYRTLRWNRGITIVLCVAFVCFILARWTGLLAAPTN